MHSDLFLVQLDDEEDIRDDVALKEDDGFSFNYNSDLSGDVIVTHQRQEDLQDINTLYEVQSEIHIPAWMLLEFVGKHMQREMQSRIDDTSGKEFLQLLLP